MEKIIECPLKDLDRRVSLLTTEHIIDLVRYKIDGHHGRVIIKYRKNDFKLLGGEPSTCIELEFPDLKFEVKYLMFCQRDILEYHVTNLYNRDVLPCGCTVTSKFEDFMQGKTVSGQTLHIDAEEELSFTDDEDYGDADGDIPVDSDVEDEDDGSVISQPSVYSSTPQEYTIIDNTF